MKKYTVTITAKEEDCVTIHTYEVIESNDLIEICARIPLVIAKIMREELEQARITHLQSLPDDDIPF